MPNPFAYRDFRFFQGARISGMVASQMQGVAVGWQVYEQTHRPLDLGYVGLAQFLPAVGLVLVTGHVADRFDRKRVLAVCHAALACCSLALFALARAHVTTPWPIYAALVSVGVARAFAAPASQALLARVVPVEAFPRALAWGASIMQVAMVGGPALGGVFYGVVHGAAPVYATCAGMSLLASLNAALIGVRTGRDDTGAKRPPALETLFAGIRYVRTNRVLLGAISLDLFAVLLGGAVALLPMYARDILITGPWGLGVLRSAPAVGALAVGIALAYRPVRRRAGAVMLACVALFGAATIVFGASRVFALSVAALLVVGAADMVSVFVRQTLIQLTTPDAMRGRVSAVNMVFIGASNELGEFESGLTAEWVGAVRAVVLGGAGTLLVVAVWSAIFPELRKVDRLTG
jgi:MFS family permease